MADLTKRIIFIVLYWISELRVISAYYCEFDFCSPDEDCCGPMKCCQKTNQTFYIIAWVLAGILIVILSYILFKHKNHISRMFTNRSSETKPLAAC